MSDYFENIRPGPAPEDLEDPLFNAIFNVIKCWDINYRTSYQGEFTGAHGGNGSDVMAILEAIRKDPQVILGRTALEGDICYCVCDSCLNCDGQTQEECNAESCEQCCDGMCEQTPEGE